MVKKTILQLVVVCLSLTLPLSIHAEIECRLAEDSDLPSLQSIYEDEITEDDTQKLVIFPSIEIQMASVAEAIKNKQLYVMFDARTNSVFSFLKMYLITDDAKVEDVLINEIRCLGADKKLEFSKTCSFSNPQSVMDNALSEFNAHDTNNENFTYAPEKQLFLYYGCQFTRHGLRDRQYSTKLRHIALMSLKNTICEVLTTTTKSNLVVLYGQVAANTHQIGIIKSIGSLINDIRMHLGNSAPQEEIQLNHMGYCAYKPTFISDETGAIRPLPDDHELTLAGKGIGNILEFNFKQS